MSGSMARSNGPRRCRVRGDMEPVVSTEGLRHRYGRRTALAPITLDIPGGRVVGLVGPDGVGKSTLLGLIA